MIWVLLGSLGNFIGDSFRLTGTQKGLMTAVPVLSGAGLRLLLGPLGERFGGRRIGLVCLALTTLPLLAGWLLADSYSRVLWLGVLLGVAGASFAVALPLASRWYPPEHQGLALGIAGAGNSGTIFASLFAPRLAQAYGWHTVFGLALIPNLIVLAAFALLAQDSPSTPRRFGLAPYLALLRQPDTGRFAALYAITFGGFVGLTGYLAIFLHQQYRLSKVDAGDLTAACVCAGSFARPLGGYLSDRFGGVRLLLMLLIAIVALLAAIATLPPFGAALLLLIALLATLGLGNGAVFQLVPLRFHREVGAITGLIGAAGGVGGFLLPFLLGSTHDRTGSYTGAFLICAAAALVVLLLLGAAGSGWHGSWARPRAARQGSLARTPVHGFGAGTSETASAE